MALAFGLDPNSEILVPISEDDLGSSLSARRPSYSALDNSVLRDLGWEPMRHHRDAIASAVARITAGSA